MSALDIRTDNGPAHSSWSKIWRLVLQNLKTISNRHPTGSVMLPENHSRKPVDEIMSTQLPLNLTVTTTTHHDGDSHRWR
ncbi:CIC11C00000001306 [Sungouiella intermedia]|uniref:CIC11C00000001306 n=1 Tax=Sungouiella intermedia TaxID=45354 RepID=A0A1L0D8Q5_9ASCO|nr:CIC11C00000001306 [[Candida] intermedia]